MAGARLGTGAGCTGVWWGGIGKASTWREDMELDRGVFSAGVV